MPLAAIVDWDALGEAVAYGLLAGVGITVAYSITLLGFTRASHAWREDQRALAAFWWTLGGLGLLACFGGIGLGLYAMTDKD